MKFFKNFKTKRQLRKENERLYFLLNRPHTVNFARGSEIHKISSFFNLSEFEIEVPQEVIKKQILHNIADEIAPFVEWNTEMNPHGTTFRGDIYLAKRIMEESE